ncbi:MAG: hypothetical protein KGI38_08975 [Thaumarchaeota archaeon]|nr:hypothetical protein [Nitrososphaerota archaeon]
MDERDDYGDERIALAEPSTNGTRPVDMGLKAAWVSMLIVGLIPFSYGVLFVVAYIISAVTGNPGALLVLEGQIDVRIMEADLATVFWGAIIIALSLKGLRRGVKWTWYLLMLIPLYYLGETVVGWPMEAALRITLALMSAAAVVLPYRYFTNPKKRTGA